MVGVFVVLALVVGVPVAWVQVGGQRGIVDSVDGLEAAPVGIVFGAGIHPNSGLPSIYLARRLQAAADAYDAGKVQVVVVSGDNGQVGYDEPTVMQDWLVGLGVPAEHIVLDYAGFDTHDTCVRANQVFGITDAVLFTQDYHLPRAMSSCRAAGLQVQGVGVSSSTGSSSLVVYRLREAPASWKSFWDGLTNRSPVYPGPPETSVSDALRDAGA